VALLRCGAPQTASQAEVEVYGAGGAARIDLSDCGGQEDVMTMISEFVDATDRNAAPVTDVQHGLHLQNVLERPRATCYWPADAADRSGAAVGTEESDNRDHAVGVDDAHPVVSGGDCDRVPDHVSQGNWVAT
jgi:hypothetical protein